MPDIVMTAPFGLAWLHRHERLAAIQRLDLGFLIDTQDDRVIGPREVKPGHLGISMTSKHSSAKPLTCKQFACHRPAAGCRPCGFRLHATSLARQRQSHRRLW